MSPDRDSIRCAIATITLLVLLRAPQVYPAGGIAGATLPSRIRWSQ